MTYSFWVLFERKKIVISRKSVISKKHFAKFKTIVKTKIGRYYNVRQNYSGVTKHDTRLLKSVT